MLINRVLAMDGTPIKAGRKTRGKIHKAYFWPIYGESDEVVFHHAASRASSQVTSILGDRFEGVLLMDGNEAYARYARRQESVTHAQCWAHTRRYSESARKVEPDAVTRALEIIDVLYGHESQIHKRKLAGEEKLKYRIRHGEPVVRAFWQWCEFQCRRHDLHPTNPLTKALKYAMARKDRLQVLLMDPDVSIDTNHFGTCDTADFERLSSGG